MKAPLLFLSLLFCSVQVFGQGISQTITYNQITNFSESHVAGQNWQHLLSDNGNKVVWYKQTNPKKVFVINPDGSGMLEVVNMESDRLSEVDISADGSKIAYVGGPVGGGHQINVVNADGSGNQMLIALDDLLIATIKIAADASKVFFCVYGDSYITGGGAIERGVYSINLDGSGLTQIVGPADVATNLGIALNDVGTFYGATHGNAIDVSFNGNAIVFIAENDDTGDYYVFSTHGGITNINGPFSSVSAVGISYDGSKVAMNVSDGGNYEGWVSSYDGTGLQMIASNDDNFYYSNGSSQGDQVSLTETGSHVMFDAFGHKFSTTDGSFNLLAAETIGSGGWPMIYQLSGPSMSKNGSRVLFSFQQQPTGLWQLAILDINPAVMGLAPVLSNINMNPNAAVAGGQAAEMSLMVTPANGNDSIRYAGNVSLKNGHRDQDVINHQFSDSGTNGDQTPGDGIFTHDNVYAYSSAEFGPRIMRFNCEVYDSELMLHGTAVDASTPFYVVEDSSQISVEEIETIGSLYAMAPNPVVRTAAITYHLKEKTWVVLSVFDAMGRKVETLDSGEKGVGNWRFEWTRPIELKGGIYTLRLVTGNDVSTQQFIISK